MAEEQAEPTRAPHVTGCILWVLAVLGVLAYLAAALMQFVPESQTATTVQWALALSGIALMYPRFAWMFVAAMRRQRSVLSAAVGVFVALCAAGFLCVGSAYAFGVDMRPAFGMDPKGVLILLGVPILWFNGSTRFRKAARP